MLKNNYFYFELIRKYITLFGLTFNDLIIERTDSYGNVTQQVNCPISYGEKNKMMERMLADPEINRQTALVLPRMSFVLDGYLYDNERKTTSTNKFVINPGSSTYSYQYKEVPYNFFFTLYVYVKNIEDGTKVIEQILPFFAPAYIPKVYLIPGRDAVNIPIDLVQITHPNYDSEDFKTRQILIWELKFAMHANIYGPIITQPPIKLIDIKFFDWDGTTTGVPKQEFGLEDIQSTTTTDTTSVLDEEVVIEPQANGLTLDQITANTPYTIVTIEQPGGSS